MWGINLKLNKEVEKIRHAVKSVRLKLFFTLCIVITLIILLLVLVNNSVLEKFYLYNKTKGMKNIYEEINTSYNNGIPYEKIEEKQAKAQEIYTEKMKNKQKQK